MDNITAVEIHIAIKSLKNNKVSGIDEIPPELLKHGHDIIVEQLTNLFNIWNNENVPVDWTRHIAVKVPKKGNMSDCNNWSGITLLSGVSRVFCRVLLRWLQGETDLTLRKEQESLRSGWSCTKQIFTLYTIIKQCFEHQKMLVINLIDFKKAFDCIHWFSLWKILSIYGIP